MAPEQIESILKKIDAAVGPPEAETPQEREARKAQISRGAERRRILANTR